MNAVSPVTFNAVLTTLVLFGADPLLNVFRSALSGTEQRGTATAIRATVPLSEMFGYVGDLRSRTQGRASYTMVFDSYAEVPSNVAKEIIAKVTGE